MDRLWTPWRYQYITKSLPESQQCIFCAKAAENADAENFILFRGRANFALLNIYPYNNGHFMIAPFQHVANLEDAPEETAVEMMRLARHGADVLRRVYRPDGINLGMNLGMCAGAGVAGHIHLHVLPRWAGDTSFMTTVGETRVVPEELLSTWKKLRDAW